MIFERSHGYKLSKLFVYICGKKLKPANNLQRERKKKTIIETMQYLPQLSIDVTVFVLISKESLDVGFD